MRERAVKAAARKRVEQARRDSQEAVNRMSRENDELRSRLHQFTNKEKVLDDAKSALDTKNLRSKEGEKQLKLMRKRAKQQPKNRVKTVMKLKV